MTRAGKSSILAAVVACAFGCTSAVAAPADGPPYPVPWTFLGALPPQGEAPNAPPPGANRPGCEPTGDRDPVILVHGLFANRTVNWQTISPLLANEGYCVWALTYGTRPSVDLPLYQPGGLLRMEDSARQLRRFVARVRERTGAAKVDIVGHSEGSLMPNYYVKFLGGARFVDDYVGITPLWDGTNLAGLATVDQIGRALGLSQGAYDLLEPFCASCHQFLNGSDFLRKMNRGGAAVPGVDYTTIMTRNDQLVIPFTSGYLGGADNHVVQRHCGLDQADHVAVAADPVTAQLVLNALDAADREPVPCTLVLPLIGALGYQG